MLVEKMNTTTNGSKTAARSKNALPNVKIEHLIAGISGGVTSTLILHPLDLIKIRFAGKFLCILIFFY